MVKKNKRTKFYFPPQFQECTVLVNPRIVAIDNIRCGIFLECIGHDAKTLSAITIIRVEPADDLSRSHLEALVQRLALAVIGLRDPTQVAPSRTASIISQ